MKNRVRCTICQVVTALAVGAACCVVIPGALQQGRAGEADGAAARSAMWRAIFARPAAPDQPPASPAKIALGYDLFRDARLSGNGTASCVTCHDPERAFTDGRKTAVGPGGAVLKRNVPALYNLAWATSFFWDGRASTLTDQAKGPIEALDELAGDLPTIARRLDADATMRKRFIDVFPATHGVTEASVLDALAAYERSLVSPETRFDRWVAGDDAALSGEEHRGFDIFVGKGGCVSCHGGWRLTDDSFHDVGLPGDDRGRGALAPDGRGLPEFKTPSLREVARTAPYMHDGSLATLEEVADHYAGGLIERPSLAATVVRDLTLTKEEKAALISFLKALSSKQNGHTTDGTTRPMLKK